MGFSLSQLWFAIIVNVTNTTNHRGKWVKIIVMNGIVHRLNDTRQAIWIDLSNEKFIKQVIAIVQR